MGSLMLNLGIVSYLPAVSAPSSTPAPEMIAIPHSSFLSAATYDATNYSLSLSFKSGHEVIHRFVFPLVWQQFKESPSHGSFYSRSIKKQYPSITFHSPLLVSHLEAAIKKHRGHALKNNFHAN